MKQKSTNILSAIAFYSIGWMAAGFTYFIVDNFRYYKKQISRKPEPEIKDNVNNVFYEKTYTTVYPEHPCKNFNDWSNHIYKLCKN